MPLLAIPVSDEGLERAFGESSLVAFVESIGVSVSEDGRQAGNLSIVTKSNLQGGPTTPIPT